MKIWLLSNFPFWFSFLFSGYLHACILFRSVALVVGEESAFWISKLVQNLQSRVTCTEFWCMTCILEVFCCWSPLVLGFLYLPLSRSTAGNTRLGVRTRERMGRSRSRSRSYSPTRRDRSRSPFRKGRRRDDDFGARRKSWRGRELGGRYSSAPTSLLVRNIARDSRHFHLPHPLESAVIALMW